MQYIKQLIKNHRTSKLRASLTLLALAVLAASCTVGTTAATPHRN
jgi:hypothetical protein